MTDAELMALAVKQARLAALSGEVPVGAVVVRYGQVIATGCNSMVRDHDPTAHAEIVALRRAAILLGNYRLDECELFATLEPCAMCSGAILNARLKRVVFGAREPKTGAAGSVINLFDQTSLNHHTRCQGGVLAEESQALMQDFFRQRRARQRTLARQHHPLRDDALRTPDASFFGLSAYPWAPNYRSDLPALDRLRLHYLDEQMVLSGNDAKQAPITYLCLHDLDDWSYQFRKLIPSLLKSGHRMVAPDLIGFGKSDKPKKAAFHTLARHRQILVELVDALDLRNIVLVLSKSQYLLALTLPSASPWRYRGLQRMNTEGGVTGDELPLEGGLSLWKQAMRQREVHQLTRFGCSMVMSSISPIDPGCDAPYPCQSYRTGDIAFTAISAAYDEFEKSDVFTDSELFWISQSKR